MLSWKPGENPSCWVRVRSASTRSWPRRQRSIVNNFSLEEEPLNEINPEEPYTALPADGGSHYGFDGRVLNGTDPSR
jgi:hypothetical protein